MPEQAAARGLLPGEQCLWSGGPARARISLSDFGLSAYLLAALVLMAILAPGFVRHLPAFFIAAVAVVWGGIVLQSVGQLIYLLVLRPRIRRGQSYIVTDRRVLVTTGLRGRRTRRRWRLRKPVVVQAELNTLLPPEIRGPMIITRPAQPPASRRRGGWKNLAWPAASTCPPVLIGIADPGAVHDLICAAQLAAPSRQPISHAKGG